jgi:hypothetical protein
MANYLGGFTALQYRNGSPYNGAVRTYVAQGNIFVGDFVKLNGVSAVPTAGPGVSSRALKGVVVATNGATEAVLGLCIGFTPNPLNLNTVVGSTAPIVSGTQIFVVDDPEVIFQGKLSGSSALTVNSLGLNTVINTGTAGANGRSGQLIDAAVANNAAAPLRVLDFVDSPDNTNAAGVMLKVMINNSQLNSATGTAGI